MATSLLIDGARPALTDPGAAWDVRPGVTADAWDFTDCYAWPVPHGPSPVTLLPALLHPDWPTTQADTGIFARDRLTHWQPGEADSWEEYSRLHAKDYVFLSKKPNAVLTSIEEIEAGCGFCCQFYAHGPHLNAGSGNGQPEDTNPGLVLYVGFGSKDDDRRLNVLVYESGQAYLSRGHNTDGSDTLASGWLVPNEWGTIVGKWVKLFVLPHSKNKILVTTNTGGPGILWEDKSIEVDDDPAAGVVLQSAQPTVTSAPKRPITDRAPAVLLGAPKTHIQPAPIRYPSLGTATPRPAQIRERPLMGYPGKPPSGPSVADVKPVGMAGPTLTSISSPPTTPIIQDPNDPYGYLINPTVTLARRDTSKSDQQRTPQLHRVEASVSPTATTKPNAGADITPDIIELEHTHTPDGMTGSLSLRYGQNHSAYQRAFNVPLQWTRDGDLFLDSILIEPRLEQRQAERVLHFGLASRMRDLEFTQLGSLTRLDGLAASDAVKKVLIACGFPSNGSMWDIDDLDAEVVAGLSASAKGNRLSAGVLDQEPTNLTDVVKTAAEWIRYIAETYTSAGEVPFRWVYGFRPFFNSTSGFWEYRFYFKNPDQMPTTPVKTLYATHALAITGGATHLTAQQSVFGKYSETTIEPEANQVIVGGVGKDGKPIRRQREDKASQAPTTVLGSRPSNWLGDVRQYILLDSSLNTPELVNGACAKLFLRLSRARLQATFEADWEPTLRIWDPVRLVYSGATGNFNDFRITSITVQHLQDNETYFAEGARRPATYTCERWLQ